MFYLIFTSLVTLNSSNYSYKLITYSLSTFYSNKKLINFFIYIETYFNII